MTDITISLFDLGVVLLWIALLVLIGYLTLVLKKFYETLKDVREIITANKENIEKTLDEMPSIAKNIDEITGEVSHDVKSVRGTIDSITEKSEAAASSLNETGDIITGIAALIQVVMFIKNFINDTFSKKRRVI